MLPPGLAAAGRAEPCDEDDLQAAEEVSPRHSRHGSYCLGGRAAIFTAQLFSKRRKIFMVSRSESCFPQENREPEIDAQN